MVDNKLLDALKRAVLEGDEEEAVCLTKKALKKKISPIDIVKKSIVVGIEKAGELWKKNEYFQTDVILSAEAFRMAMEIVEPLLRAEDVGKAGKIIIGTVAGDMHNLGKILVIVTLRSAGYQVIDLGEDVPTDTFIDKVKEINPVILGLGCYMTTTMSEMKIIIERLKSEGLRNKLKVIIGGVPLTQQFADEIGADAWGKDAFDAVEKVKKIMEVS